MRRPRIHPLSVKGKYYIESDVCVCSAACVTEAPELIRIDEEEGIAFIAKQPENDVEREQMKQAIRFCPVEAIVDDGDEIDPSSFTKIDVS